MFISQVITKTKIASLLRYFLLEYSVEW